MKTCIEPGHAEDKYAVAVFDKKGWVISHLPKDLSGRYNKTTNFLLKPDELSYYTVKHEEKQSVMEI